MTRNNKTRKTQRQRGLDVHSAASLHSTSKTLPRFSKHGTANSNSKPTESWDKTNERAAITRRAKRVSITLPGLPWDGKED